MRALAPTLALALLPTAVFGQTRPLQTEEATTAPAGRIALEVGAGFISAQPNFATGLERDRWDAPQLNLVYSPAANVEIDLGWVARVIAVDDPTFGTVSDFGDVTLRTKLRFFDEKGGRPAFSARYGVTLPETRPTKGLGPNTMRMSAQLLLSKTAGRARIHANAGLAIHDKALQQYGQYDLLAYGVAAELELGKRTRLLAEVAGRAGEGQPAIDRTHEARLGVRLAGGRVTWDAALRRGLSDSDGDWGFTAGLSWVLKREGRPR